MAPILYHTPATASWLCRHGFMQHICGLWYLHGNSNLGYRTSLWVKEGLPQGEIRRRYADLLGHELKAMKVAK